MTKTKDCQPICIKLPNFLAKPCTQGIKSKVYHKPWQSFVKLPLLLPEAIFLLDQIYLDFQISLIFGGQFPIQSRGILLMFLEMQSFSVTKKRTFTEYLLTGLSFGVDHDLSN